MPAKHTHRIAKQIKPYLFILPFFLIYAIFSLYPLFSGVATAMTLKNQFVGLRNISAVLRDSQFWKAFSNATLYMCGSIFIIIPIALLAALMLGGKSIGRLRSVVSTVFFLPNVTSVLVIGIVFKLLLRTNNGTFNTLLMALGLIDKPLKFLRDPDLAMVSLMIVCIWRFFGINSLYFLNGLQSIPTEICEAGRIDGCNGFKEFVFIKLPLLKPIFNFVVFTAIMGSYSLSVEVYTLVGVGGTGTKDSMLFPVVYIYNTMFRDTRMNYSAAIGYVLALLLLAITSVQRYLFRDKD